MGHTFNYTNFKKTTFPLGLARNKNGFGIGIVGLFSILALFRPISKLGQILSSTLFFQIMLLPKSSLSSGLKSATVTIFLPKSNLSNDLNIA